jgi:hypothetical protein
MLADKLEYFRTILKPLEVVEFGVDTGGLPQGYSLGNPTSHYFAGNK